jgi:hypothetical protein
MTHVFPVTHAMTHFFQNKTPRPPLRDAGFRIGMLVPKTGLEPVRGCPHRFLRPKRLPFRHSGALEYRYDTTRHAGFQHYICARSASANRISPSHTTSPPTVATP